MDININRSERISLLRTLLIFGIVALHIPPSIQFPANEVYASSSLLFAKIFFEKTLFKAAVPTLTVISGYLFFLKYAQRGYFKSLKNKVRTLLIPLLIWNIPLVFMVFALQAKGVGEHSFRLTLYPVDWRVLMDATLGITQSPINFPLLFLRDLFACALVAPLYYFFIKKAPWLGLIALIAIVVLSIPNPIILRPSILIGFYLGGLIATYKWQLKWVDKGALFFILSFFALSLYVTILGFDQVYDSDAKGLGQWINILRLNGVFAFWGLSGLLVSTLPGRWLIELASRSFFIFCAHGPLMVLTWLFCKTLVGDTSHGFYTSYYLCVAPVVILLSLTLARLIEMIHPELYGYITGNRVSKIQKEPAKIHS